MFKWNFDTNTMLLVAPILCAVLSVVAEVPDDQPYCAVRYRRMCQGKGRHIGCQYPDPGPGVSCQNYSPIKFQDNLKHFITHYINRRRQRIASGNERVRGGVHLPKPEIMMMVEWDRELALLAQRLADQCTFVHDDCRATVRYPYAGQTVGEVRWRRSSASDELTAQRAIRRVFDAWWGERRRVQPHQLTEPFRITAKGAVWGHFSQLAVWSLRAVGCGAVRHGVNFPRLLLVCDFSHTNMLGQRTLTPGPPARCPVHTARKPRSSYSLLCGPVRFSSKAEEYEEREADEDPGDEGYKEDEEEEIGTEVATAQNLTIDRMPFVETTTMKRRQFSTKQVKETSEDSGKTDYGFQVVTRKPQIKGSIMDKLDRELEVRKKVISKTQGAHGWRYRQSTENWRILYTTTMIDEEENTTPEPVSKRTHQRDDYDDDMRRPITDGPEQIYGSRHKWQKTRDRPRRPGESALLNVPVVSHTQRRPVASLMLDNEDVAQLFRDTGFNPHWARQRPEQ